jgi:uncharacterized protein (TIGR03492 family)
MLRSASAPSWFPCHPPVCRPAAKARCDRIDAQGSPRQGYGPATPGYAWRVGASVPEVRPPPRVVVISNGHGEDEFGAGVARILRAGGAELRAAPLVGLGRAYLSAGIPVVTPTRDLPSGGFVHLRVGRFLRDLGAGWWSLTRGQLRALRELREWAEGVLVFGDAWALWVATRGLGRRVVHAQPLVSHHYRDGPGAGTFSRMFVDRLHPIELRLMRRWADRVFLRDAFTTLEARAAGLVQAEFCGSFAMAALGSAPPLPAPAGTLAVALLPGSRADAPAALRRMIRILEQVSARQPVLAWLKILPALESVAPPPGWEASGRGWIRGAGRVELTRAPLAAVLGGARVALGAAGTANEQAAGAGVPIAGLVGATTQFDGAFALAQSRLLGRALRLCRSDAEAVVALLALAEEGPPRKAALDDGRERMPAMPGTLESIAAAVLNQASSRGSSSGS